MSEKIDYTKLDLVKMFEETVVSEDVLKDAGELVKENSSSKLIGQGKSDVTMEVLTMKRIVKLKEKVRRFEAKIEALDLAHEEKKLNLRENWEIDIALKEIESLTQALKDHVVG